MWTKSDAEEAERMDGTEARRQRWTDEDEAAIQEIMRERGVDFPDIVSPF